MTVTESLAESMRQAVASLRLEGMELTPDDLAALERIASGEITVEQSIQIEYDKIEKMYNDHPEKFSKIPDFLEEKLKKQRNK